MKKMMLTLSVSALVILNAAAVSQAQQNPPGNMMQQGQSRMDNRAPSAGESDRKAAKMMDRKSGHGDQRAMMGADRRGGAPGMMASGMMGSGMMGSGMMRMMMMAMMDTDGDGALSLEEVQAVHARMFGYVDADGDGKLTTDELRTFFRSDTDDWESDQDD